jgi:DNA helicase HerA-like ATPase
VKPEFRDAMAAGYDFPEPTVVLGGPMLESEVAADVRVKAPLAMLNRHGLIAGATGTGKTKTLQILAGELSEQGVPCFIADIKGDVTGIALPGDPADPRVAERAAQLNWPYQPKGHPVEFLSLSGKLGAQVRATVHSFGPVLLSKVMDLNQTQTAVLALIFKYCDDNQLPLLDLADLRTTLQYLSSDEGKVHLADYGGMSTATVGVLLRSIVTLESSGADAFFGEPEFDVADLLRTAPDGRGVISVMELRDVIDKPRLFSTFMLWMLAQLYHELPEMGDLPKPKLAFFFDEAHLLFNDASDALMEQVELTVRLIRSKGVGVYFVTQAPTDVPSSVLAQLGNRVQHALRAFTPNDADNLRKAARTFPVSEFYDVETALQSLGIGDALVTVLTPRGVPSPLAATRLIPPDSSMAALSPEMFWQMVVAGSLQVKYGATIDRQSAHEIITGRIQSAQAAVAQAAAAQQAAANQAAAAQQTIPPGYPGLPPGAKVITRGEYDRQVRAQARQMERERKAAEKAAAAERRRQATAERAARREREQMIRTGGSVLRSVLGTLFGGGRRR